MRLAIGSLPFAMPQERNEQSKYETLDDVLETVLVSRTWCKQVQSSKSVLYRLYYIFSPCPVEGNDILHHSVPVTSTSLISCRTSARHPEAILSRNFFVACMDVLGLDGICVSPCPQKPLGGRPSSWSCGLTPSAASISFHCLFQEAFLFNFNQQIEKANVADGWHETSCTGGLSPVIGFGSPLRPTEEIIQINQVRLMDKFLHVFLNFNFYRCTWIFFNLPSTFVHFWTRS